MTTLRLSAGLALAILLAGCAGLPRADFARTAKRWHADVSAFAAADGNQARRKALHARLQALGLAPRAMPFGSDDEAGVNLLADVAGRADIPLLLIGAHYDRVDAGRGATDNASGSAAVLALAERLRRTPLRNHRVAVAFWDLEERGLLGAAAYVADGREKPALYVNLDVFGWGDTLWMMSPRADAPLVGATRAASQAAELQFVSGDQYPPTDHLAFLKAGWPAVSYSLVGRDEIPLILEMFAGRTPASTPKVMQVIHRDADTIEQVDAAAAARGIDALEEALRAWDASAARSGG